MRTARTFTNFELLVEWRHLESGGNSGVFVWVPEQALAALKPGVLPDCGIEVQMLDHGYAEQFEQKQTGQEGGLVHDQRRRLRGRQVDAQAVPADLAERLAQLPAPAT